MNRLFDTLPGVAMPVPQVTRQIANMWRETEKDGEQSNAHALQMNLVIHFGLETSMEEGKRIFEVAIEFSQRHPSRVILLCPEESSGEEIALDSKLYSQCFLGEKGHGKCCCEALVLGYNTNEAIFLNDQLSVWLASDLPVYHWIHRPAADFEGEHSRKLFANARRVVFDSEVDGSLEDVGASIQNSILSDLAQARIVRFKQSLGQFLSAIPVTTLVSNLVEVKMFTKKRKKAEALLLLSWQERRLRHCSELTNTKLNKAAFHLEDLPDQSENVMAAEWIYEGNKSLQWELRDGSETAWVETSFNNRPTRHPLRADPFQPAKALSEALFFNLF